MGCDLCGSPTSRSGLCKPCALDQRYSSGPVGGRAGDDRNEDASEEWAVEQQGLGDADPEGQARLDGGIVKNPEGGEE